MAKITQYSRISHHTLAGSMSATFSVPTSEDFTDGTWTANDLALSEIGVNEDAGSAYIRIGSDIKQFQLAGVTASAEPLSTTLAVGNTTGANDIIVDLDRQIKTTDIGYIQFGDTGADLNAITIRNGGDGVTIPANSLGFSGADPYFTAQTVDIGGKTDTLSLDPTNLVNGTGIKSEDTLTADLSYSNIQPTLIRLFQDDITNGQQRRIDIGSQQISLINNNSSLLLDDISGGRITLTVPSWNTLPGPNYISIGSAASNSVYNSISTGTQQTTNNTITTIYTFTCSSSGPKTYKVRVVGYKDDYTKAYLAELFGLYLYDGATVSLIGTLDKVEKTNFTTATSTIDISGVNIRIRVTGETSTTINWSVYVEMNDIQ